MGTEVRTYSGAMLDMLRPDPERILLSDIAHALSQLSRHTGHGTLVFTVAQHCVLTSDMAPDEAKRWALLHDAEEAYINDLATPLKEAMRTFGFSAYDEITSRIRCAISARFGVQEVDVLEWDLAAYRYEVSVNGPNVDGSIAYDPRSHVWASDVAEFLFLRRAHVLGIS